jgi:hypothetical protein
MTMMTITASCGATFCMTPSEMSVYQLEGLLEDNENVKASTRPRLPNWKSNLLLKSRARTMRRADFTFHAAGPSQIPLK